MNLKFERCFRISRALITLFVTVILLGNQAYAETNCFPAPAGLAGWWKAENSAADSAGTNAGVFGGGLGFSSGWVGQSFNFTGTDFLVVPASSSTDVGMGSGISIETWVKPSDAASRPLVEWSFNGGYGAHVYLNRPEPGQIYVNWLDTEGASHVLITTSSVLLINFFTHVAVTYEKSSGIARIYINGMVAAQEDLGKFTPQTSHDMCLGYRLPGAPFGEEHFQGLIDEFSLYKRALSTNEVRSIFMAGTAGKCDVIPSTPPEITTQPISQTVTLGSNAVFSVVANGTAPLSYQWRWNGSNLLGKTEATLRLDNVQTNNAGNYSVSVNNDGGEVVSSNALLNVVMPPTECAPPPVGLVGWWKAEGNGLDFVGNNNGVVGGSLTYAEGKVGQAFSYSGAGPWLRIPASTSLNVGVGAGFTLEAWIQPTQTPSMPIFEWSSARGYGVLLYANFPVVGQLYGVICETNGTLHLLQSKEGVLRPASFQHVALTYDKASGLAQLYVDGLPLVKLSVGAVTPKTDTDLTVGFRVPEAPYGAGYFKGLIDEPSLYRRALSTNEVWAIYHAGVAGKCLILPPIPPEIASQPSSQSVPIGSNAVFSVVATGTAPFSYQWRFNGINLVSQTNQALVLTNTQITNAGNYSVYVSNSGGSVLSSNAVLTLLSTECVPTPAGLVSWWKGEVSGVEAIAGNNAVLGGGLTFVPGVVGQSFSFNGSNAFITVPSNALMDIGKASGMTIESWVRPGDTTPRPLFEWSPNGTYGAHVYVNHPSAGAIYVNLFDTQGGHHIFSTQGGLIARDVYSHFALTYNKASGVLRVLINGAVVSEANLGGFSPQTSYDLCIGYRLPGAPFGVDYFKGQIDEVSLYARALSTEEIQTVFSANARGKCIAPQPPVVISQPFDQTGVVGQNLDFSITAAGAAPLLYQWFFNSNPILGATNQVLPIRGLRLSDAGVYSVTVSNSIGFVNSSNVSLTVTYPPAALRVPNVTAGGGRTVMVPVILSANGNENALGFSLNFSTNALTYAGAKLGSNVPNGVLLINTNQLAGGRLGLAFSLSSDATLDAGQMDIVEVSFVCAAFTNSTSTAITFGDLPTKRQLADARANVLTASYSSGMVSITPAELEADVSPRPNADGAVSITDWVQVGRYVGRLDFPTNGTEFGRADCAPRETSGNGVLSVADWVQSGRYAAGLDPLQLLDGPTSPASSSGAVLLNGGPGRRDLSRRITVESAQFVEQQPLGVGVYLESQGDENALGFSVSFNSEELTFTGAAMGPGAFGSQYNLNTSGSSSGRLAVIIARPIGSNFPAGKQQILKLNFSPRRSGPAVCEIALVDQPVPREISNANADTLAAQFVGGTITIHPPPLLSAACTDDKITISWPAWVSDLELFESSGDLLPTLSWTLVPNPSVQSNDQRSVTIPATGNYKLYRLQQP